MKKKILYIITKATYGGAQKYVFDLATHVPKERFDVVVAYGTEGKLADDLAAAHIRTLALPSLGRDVALLSDIKSFFEIWRCLRKERPDTVHLNSSKAAALGALAARLAGVRRVVFTVHGWPFKEKRGDFARVMIFLVSWLTAFLSDAVIVVSTSDETQGKQMRWIAEKIRYVPIGIESAAYLRPDEARAALGIGDTTAARIITVAELTPNKGLQYAIEALSICGPEDADTEYFIIGTGEQRIELEDFAAEMGVERRVHFLGFIENAARYLGAFDVFLLPSVKEGMPYVLLEAANAGLPIITTTVVNAEFIERSKNAYTVPPGDPEAIASAITEVLSRRTNREKLPAEHQFPLAHMVEKTVELYA